MFFNRLKYIETCIRAPPSDEKPGILPLEIRKLVDSRRQVKQLASQTTNPELKMQVSNRFLKIYSSYSLSNH